MYNDPDYSEQREDAQNALQELQAPMLSFNAMRTPAMTNPPAPQGIQWSTNGAHYRARMQSHRVADDFGRMVLPQLVKYIRADMREIYAPPSYLHSRFDQTMLMPEDLAENFLEKSPLGLIVDHQVLAVGTLHNELHAAEYLNSLVYALSLHVLGTSTVLDVKRYWSAGRHHKVLSTGAWLAKPDLMLLPLVSGHLTVEGEEEWADILAVGEMSSSSGPTEIMIEEINHSRDFIRVIAFLATCNPALLGLDTSMTRKDSTKNLQEGTFTDRYKGDFKPYFKNTREAEEHEAELKAKHDAELKAKAQSAQVPAGAAAQGQATQSEAQFIDETLATERLYATELERKKI
ncbi:hypothetical protein H0H92_010263 [Tricholoma furcatifolium]|nr:hypothetical protein H0H92_010263 [Tricholoma furcatifolium]